MNDRQRQRLLDRIRRKSATIGEELPETVTVQGTEVNLREFVFECKRLDTIPEDERDRIEEMKRRLKRERLARKQRVAEADISYEEGEALVESITGIDRALTALEGLDSPDLSEKLRRKKLEDARDLLAMIEQLPD